MQKALQARIIASGGRRTANKVQHYINTCSAHLDARPAYKALFTQLVQRVYEGVCLGTEGLIDVLTMKENKGDAAGDAAEALTRLAFDMVRSLSVLDPSSIERMVERCAAKHRRRTAERLCGVAD